MSAHEMKQRMEAILAARAEAITPLLDVQGQRAELLKQLALLDEPYGKAYAEAEAGGWTAEELAALGAEEPVKRPKARPRARRTNAKKGAGEAAASATSEASSPAVVPAQDSTGSAAPVGSGAQSS
ncbi:hypothetical protein ACFV2Q_27445 [Streptomyces sp. NPDC059650]|uniref:hypothetical protein n=1 Tax=Streptomyces sp. NPDC059650 TaxID=3346896 RepID=UPI0036892C46